MNLVLFALWLLSLTQEEKVLLKFQPKVGDKMIRVEKMSTTINATVTQGKETQDLVMEEHGSEKKTIEIVELADGKPVKVLFDFEEDIEERKGPGAKKFMRHEKPLHGKKLTLSLKDGKKVVEGVDGLDEKTIKDLDLYDKFSHLFPKNPIAIGESWEVQGKDLQEALDDEEAGGKVVLKLVKVEEINGLRCALLDAAFDVTGKTDDGLDLGMKVNGQMVIWLDRGYTLKIQLKGSISLAAETVEMTLKGEGPMEVDVTATIP